MIESRLAAELTEIADLGLTRRRRVLESPCGRIATVDGKKMLNFASNDYLGLAGNVEIAQAMADGALEWGAGSGASHLVSGHLAPHQVLENQIAGFLGFPRALTFSTGYLANLAIVPTLAGRGAAVFADKLNHASLIDAMQLAKTQGADTQRYPHNDMATLEKQLAASSAPTKLIVSDAVFSMDGDLAPLPLLLQLAERYDAWLVIDDAHGFGVLGAQGKGSLAHFNLPAASRILLMGTLGKAAGVGGAFVAGSEIAIEYLLQRARSYIFTTAAPPAVACALLKSLQMIEQGDARRANLLARIGQLRNGLSGLRWPLLASLTAIQPLIIGDNASTVALAQRLWERGLWVPAIRPPTVPKDTARLRISVSAAHTADDIEQLIQALKALA
jgi:8-amino-7-oxononanoate synthase